MIRRSLSLVDIDADPKPLYDLPVFVSQGLCATQMPTINPVCSSDPMFVAVGTPGRKSLLEFFDDVFPLFRVSGFNPSPLQLCQLSLHSHLTLSSMLVESSDSGVLPMNHSNKVEAFGSHPGCPDWFLEVVPAWEQVTSDFDEGLLYWGDREGMRVMRSNLEGSKATILVRNGGFPADSHDVMRHCVGIAVDPVSRYIYWTQKGHPDGGKGRIFRAGLEIPADQQPENRTDIELLIDHLPEPIDLELDTKNNILYWTDRGNLDGGNSLNRAGIGAKQLENHEVLATGLQEGIGLAIDHANQRAFTTELGGEVRVAPLKVNAQFTTIAKLGVLTGIAYVA